MNPGNIFLKYFYKIELDDGIHYVTRSMNPDIFILMSESDTVEVQYMSKEELLECFPILDKKLERL